MNSKEELLAEFARIDREIHRARDTSYGASVMPYLELYASLSSYEPRRAFQSALEAWLGAEDATTRSKAVNICLGFFVFREAIKQ